MVGRLWVYALIPDLQEGAGMITDILEISHNFEASKSLRSIADSKRWGNVAPVLSVV